MQPTHRLGRSLLVTVIYLAGFALLILWLARYYLLPAYATLDGATPEERQWLSAWSILLMSVVLVLLITGLILTFRVGRYFLPREGKPSRTDYPDAWQESARRLRDD
jgi:uncharacterized membrane protein YdjX (TVP38/TMEM64 family)